MAQRSIVVSTLEGQRFEVKFDDEDGNCWSCCFPEPWTTKVRTAMKFHDDVEVWADGTITLYSGSMHRILELIADYIGECEA